MVKTLKMVEQTARIRENQPREHQSRPRNAFGRGMRYEFLSERRFQKPMIDTGYCVHGDCRFQTPDWKTCVLTAGVICLCLILITIIIIWLAL